MTRLLTALAAVLGLLALPACQPTGHIRCDVHTDILDEIESHGWTINCDPDFPNVGGQGQTIWGWADQKTHTVYAWPREIRKDNIEVWHGPNIGEWHAKDDNMRWLLWHELAHVTGINDEQDANQYAWCREPLIDWDRSHTPCEQLGA